MMTDRDQLLLLHTFSAWKYPDGQLHLLESLTNVHSISSSEVVVVFGATGASPDSSSAKTSKITNYSVISVIC